MSETTVLGESFLTPLHRHFLNVMCLNVGEQAKSSNGGLPLVLNFSAFVCDVCGDWYAITAGHIFQDLQKEQAQGSKFENWTIDDSAVSDNPKEPYPIPMDIDKDVLWISDDVPGMDYACFRIVPLAREAMEKEGIRAIPSDIWKATDLAKFGIWLLVGTPLGYTKLKLGARFVKQHATILLTPLPRAPEGWPETTYQRAYAEIRFDSVAGAEGGFDIKGMSGGPVFALKSTVDAADYEYRIVGVQSAWWGGRYAALCLAMPFIQALELKIAGKDVSSISLSEK